MPVVSLSFRVNIYITRYVETVHFQLLFQPVLALRSSKFASDEVSNEPKLWLIVNKYFKRPDYPSIPGERAQ